MLPGAHLLKEWLALMLSVMFGCKALQQCEHMNMNISPSHELSMSCIAANRSDKSCSQTAHAFKTLWLGNRIDLVALQHQLCVARQCRVSSKLSKQAGVLTAVGTRTLMPTSLYPLRSKRAMMSADSSAGTKALHQLGHVTVPTIPAAAPKQHRNVHSYEICTSAAV